MSVNQIQAVVPAQREESTSWSQANWYEHVETYLRDNDWAEFIPKIIGCIARALEWVRIDGATLIVTPALVDAYIDELTAQALEDTFGGTFRRGE